MNKYKTTQANNLQGAVVVNLHIKNANYPNLQRTKIDLEIYFPKNNFPQVKTTPQDLQKLDYFDEDFDIFDEDLTKIFVANMLDYEIF